MTVNGAAYDHSPGLTLPALLDALAIDPRKVVVMHGNAIYRPGSLPPAPVMPNDEIEIVTMMQGG